MEATTAASAAPTTGSKTIADLLPLAAERYGEKVAVRHKVDGDWRDVTYAEVGEIVSEIGRGLIAQGIEAGDRVSILCGTRPEWTYCDFAISTAGATVVPIYPTNSPEECEWVAGNSEARAVICEDAAQVAKIVAVRERLPNLQTIVVVDPSGDVADAVSLEDVRAQGRDVEQSVLDERTAAVTPDDAFTFIYTSGTTGPPKGCLLTHANYRDVTTLTEERRMMGESDEVVYLFLPLAHAFAKLVQFVTIDSGGAIAYWEKDAAKIIPNLAEVKPTYFPSVPRMFEKIYTLATNAAPDKEQLGQAVQVGIKVRQLQQRGEEVPAELQAGFDAAEEALYKNVRAIFGGRIRQCVTGAAPIAQEILEFFYACGIPVMEGYGMTETSTVATGNVPDDFRFGSVGKPLTGVEAKVAEDGELLLRGPNIFQGYYKNETATSETIVDGWLHTGDLGKIDDDGFVYITGRKKDIIITAGGKNITPANLENGLKQNRWVSQAVVIGDRRPYLIALLTLDPDEVPAFAEQHGIAVDDVPGSEEMKADVQATVDAVNAKVGPVERIKYFHILPHDLSQETGELTPTLKVKRNIVNEKFADVVDSVYENAGR
jgi:long-chain acyl-CoA synthetase